MKNNRILILTGIFLGDIGGPATQLDPLIRELIKNNYQVRVLTFGSSDRKNYSYPVRRISNYWPGFIKKFLYIINGLFFALRSDIIYNQDLYTAGLTSLIIKKVLRKKLITRFVENPIWQTGSFSKIRKAILFNSDKIIVVSYFLKDLTMKIGLPEERIKVIYNSIDFLEQDILKSKNELKKELNLNNDEKILLTIARLTPWKGVAMLINIMPRLIEKYGKVKLIIIGDGSERNNLENLKQQLNLKKNVLFTGQINHQQVVSYLKIADLFVLNTHHEGMSHCLLEAMKMSVPIITTKVGGNLETIKHKETGLLVDYNNEKQWVEAISSILENPDLAQKLINNAKEDLRRFSWDNLIKETIDIFENI